MRALLVAVAVLLFPSTAFALPPDPPVTPLTPADGAVGATNPEGFVVTYACPAYGIYESGDFTFYGGPKDYSVSLSTAPDAGADGRLLGSIVAVRGNLQASGTCSAVVGSGAEPRPQVTPGTYYWQVWRLCTGCATGYEVGPVRTLTLRSPIKPRLTLPARVYGGYPALIGVTAAGAPDGTGLALERQTGATWTRVGTVTLLGGRAEAVVTLPRGRQTLRATLQIGTQAIASDGQPLIVTAARRWTTAKAEGAYRGAGVRFKVTDRGRRLRVFRAAVRACPGRLAKLNLVKVAPDGSFVAARGGLRVRGTIRGRKATGRVELAAGTCLSAQAFSARHR
ncbi:MAG TPA: hypothetical protein VNS09_05400 [Solirubrobacter sp.]|nr:hypothetical protein [Solirubrobacter sp.]